MSHIYWIRELRRGIRKRFILELLYIYSLSQSFHIEVNSAGHFLKSFFLSRKAIIFLFQKMSTRLRFVNIHLDTYFANIIASQLKTKTFNVLQFNIICYNSIHFSNLTLFSYRIYRYIYIMHVK